MLRAGRANLNLGVWLDQAAFGGIEENSMVLRFDAGRKQARAIVEKAENRRALETALLEMTENLTTFRTEITDTVHESPERKTVEDSLPRYASANPDDVRNVMENPQVAKILDVFKGRVVEVKFTTSAASEIQEP